MSLPAAQQRALDSIADRLHASEPRLAAMFATFTSLTPNEARPGREQLPGRYSARHLLAWLRMRLWARPVRYLGRRRWRQVLIISPVVLALATAGLVLSFAGGSGPACQRSTATSARLGAVACGVRTVHPGTAGAFAR
ncbi:MAG TPA: hypothetical protein VGI58_02405 [Streptosporangiaceae bacterium]|jgi:hypothetical protein